MPDKQVADVETSGVELVHIDTESMNDFAAAISGLEEYEPVVSSAEETKYRIAAEIMAAESEDEMWKELPTWSTKNSIGKVFKIEDVRGVFRSKFPDPDTGKQGAFVALSAVDTETGEVGILTSSALRFCARVGWYKEHDKLPVVLEVTLKGETDKGFPIIDAKLAA